MNFNGNLIILFCVATSISSRYSIYVIMKGTYFKRVFIRFSDNWDLNRWSLVLQNSAENTFVHSVVVVHVVVASWHKDCNIFLAIMKVNIQQIWPHCHVWVWNVPRKLRKLRIFGFFFILHAQTIQYKHIKSRIRIWYEILLEYQNVHIKIYHDKSLPSIIPPPSSPASHVIA